MAGKSWHRINPNWSWSNTCSSKLTFTCACGNEGAYLDLRSLDSPKACEKCGRQHRLSLVIERYKEAETEMERRQEEEMTRLRQELAETKSMLSGLLARRMGGE